MKSNDRTLAPLAREWLDAMAADHDELTVASYGYYLRQAPFATVDDLTTPRIHDWIRSQLKVVTAKTVKKKKAALRQLCFWLVEQGHLRAVPEIAPLPPRALGTRDTTRRHKRGAVPLTMEQAEAWVAALPEWAWPGKDRRRRFRVRPRFVVALYTALRPATLDTLRCPQDYRRGSKELIIRDEADKARWGRSLALDAITRAALDDACPDVGLIFGRHDYRGPLRKAAILTLPLDIARDVTQYDLRHARLTHMLEHTRNLAGVAYQSGHRRLDTLAAYYLHPSRRAQESVLRDMEHARQLLLPGFEPGDRE